MSLRLTSRSRVKLAAVSAGVLAALVSAPAAGAATWSSTLDYTCRFPLMKPQPLKLKISAEIPATVAVNAPTGPFRITATAAVNDAAATGLRALFSTSIEGNADAESKLTFPDNTAVDVTVPTKIPKQAIPATGGFETSASGQTLSLRLQKIGRARITVGDLVLRLTPRLVDGETTGLSEFETECFQVAGQNNQLATIDVVPEGTSTPTPTPTVAPPTPTPTVAPPTPTPTVAPQTPTPTPPPGLKYSYDIGGSATLKTLTKGSMPLSGTADANLVLSTGAFTAKIALNETQGNLVALGFLPVTAKTQIIPLTDATGTLTESGLTAKTQVRIKLPEIKALGIPLGGGKDCQAKNPSQINLSAGPEFDPLNGGTLTGVFSISDLTGCGFLNGLISPLTAGNGNAIALKLTKKSAA